MSTNKRREMDVYKLMMSNYKVCLNRDHMGDITVEFPGPIGSLYQGGTWKIHVEIPDQYPFKSPSIGFETKIFHPNVDEPSGSICLDVLNQAWSPMFDLRNIFDSFIPQLLLYPNPNDPLNGQAASLLLKSPDVYNKRVRDSVIKYAMVLSIEEQISDISSREDLSELSETSDLDPDLL